MYNYNLQHIFKTAAKVLIIILISAAAVFSIFFVCSLSLERKRIAFAALFALAGIIFWLLYAKRRDAAVLAAIASFSCWNTVITAMPMRLMAEAGAILVLYCNGFSFLTLYIVNPNKKTVWHSILAAIMFMLAALLSADINRFGFVLFLSSLLLTAACALLSAIRIIKFRAGTGRYK